MVEKDRVQQGYDGVSEEYASRRQFREFEQQLVTTFLDRLPSESRVLDGGCGTGEPMLAALADELQDVVGLDISSVQVARTTKNVPTVSVAQGDLARLPFETNSFDAVTAFYSIIHLPAAQHQPAFEEFARVMEPGGWLLVTEGESEWSGTNPDWLDTGVEMQWYIAGQDETRSQLREAGFRIENEWVHEDEMDGGTWSYFLAQCQ